MSLHSTESELRTIHVYKRDNFCKKYMGWIRYTTVEPTMWFYMMSYTMTSVIEQAFFVHKSCTVDHGLSEEECQNLNETTTVRVQVTVSNFHQWNNIAGNLVPFILAFYFGNWSDKRGRKLPLIIGLTGKLIYAVMMIVNSLMDTWNLNMVAYTASLPMGFFGADVAILASLFAYISDVSSSQQRTLRVSILYAVYLSSTPIGVALGSYVYTYVVNSSYTIMFAINSTLLVLAIVYSLIVMDWRTTSEQTALNGKNPVTDFFDNEHVRQSVKTLTRRRSGYTRLYIWIILIAMALYTFHTDENQMSYLYTSLTFGWDVTTFSTFRTFQSSMYVLAIFFGMPIMSKVLGMRDTMIIVVGTLSHATCRVIFALAEIPELFYVGAATAVLGPSVAAVLRSMTSKVVPSTERGKIFAFLAICNNAVSLFSGVLYSQLYNATLNTTPSSIYWLTFSTHISILLLIMIIHVTLGSRELDAEHRDEGGFLPQSPATATPSPVVEKGTAN